MPIDKWDIYIFFMFIIVQALVGPDIVGLGDSFNIKCSLVTNDDIA